MDRARTTKAADIEKSFGFVLLAVLSIAGYVRDGREREISQETLSLSFIISVSYSGSSGTAHGIFADPKVPSLK